MRFDRFGTRTILSRLLSLFRRPVFLLFTIWGNGCLLLGAWFFHRLESGRNPGVASYLDSVAWAVGTFTTVGHSTVTPQTEEGKILWIVMMLGGSIFLWSYMALFVGALVSPEIGEVERELKRDIKLEEAAMQRLDRISEELGRISAKLG